MTNPEWSQGKPLRGMRVLDLSHQYSGAFAASLLRDMGASVIAVENPKGSPIRTMLPKIDGDSVWWKVYQRDKRNITLSLSNPKSRPVFLELARRADVIIENFRPGTMEKWGIGPSDLEAEGIECVLVRISGFGQTGPARGRPGFGTAAEAMSGFAHLNGFPDGPPALPSTTLGDGVAALFGVIGALASLQEKSLGAPKLRVVDIGLYEGLFKIIPNQITILDRLGKEISRYGNSLLDKGVLRDLFQSSDGQYYAIGGGIGEPSIRRTLTAVGALDLVDELDAGALRVGEQQVREFFRRAHQRMVEWTQARTYEEAAKVLDETGVVFAPVYTPSDIIKDDQYHSRGDLVAVPDGSGGTMIQPGAVPKLGPASFESDVTGVGRERGAYNTEVFHELGLSDAEIEELARSAAI